jgi:hypothetical protein
MYDNTFKKNLATIWQLVRVDLLNPIQILAFSGSSYKINK